METLVIDRKKAQMQQYLNHIARIFGPEFYDEGLAAIIYMQYIETDLPPELPENYLSADVSGRDRQLEKLTAEYVGRYFIKIQNGWLEKKRLDTPSTQEG